MKHLFSLIFVFSLVSGVRAQDTLGLSIRNEIYPVISTKKDQVGDGIAFEIQKKLNPESRLGIGYNKMNFGEHSARNMEVVYYNESDQSKKVQVNLGVGFFVRQWSDMVFADQKQELQERKTFTTGYVLSLGAKANLTERLAFATRFSFNNNISSEMTYSLRPGIIFSI